jgi:uncharacterized phage protein gp47/JayE
MSGLTADGFERKRLIDIKETIETALKAAFGGNIDLSPQSGFGQFIGIVSEALADQWESQENVYNSQYPSTAQGNQLSNVVDYNGITRQDATFSTVTATITGLAGTFISAGSLASVASTGVQFETLVEVTIPVSGTVDVNMQAVETGAKDAVAGTLTQIDSPVYGWTSITNASDATTGRDEETDAELRIRREQSTQALGQNLVDSLFGQLLNLDGVEDAVVISNGTNTTDANGIPAHQFLSVVLGGVESDIVSAIWKNTPQGISSFGAVTAYATDDQGFPQTVKYSRPAEVPIYFAIYLTVDSNIFESIDINTIKANIVTYGQANFKISDNVIKSEFYCPINQTDGILNIDLRIGTAPTPTGTDNIEIDAEEIADFDTSYIVISATT